MYYQLPGLRWIAPPRLQSVYLTQVDPLLAGLLIDLIGSEALAIPQGVTREDG